MRRPHVVRCDPFGVGLVIATRRAHLRWAEKQFPGADFTPPGPACTHTVIGDTGTLDIVVWVDPHLKQWRPKRERAKLAAHEGAHVAQFILDHIGETATTSECHAYLTDWAAGHIWDALNA